MSLLCLAIGYVYTALAVSLVFTPFLITVFIFIAFDGMHSQ